MTAEAACSFCGKKTGEVKRLFQGPGVWICDGCVRASYQILEQLEGEPAPTPDPVMAAITEAQQMALAGDRAAARERFGELWDRIGPHGDPMHRVALAHYMADAQDDPAVELEWDVRALAAADANPDRSAVRGMYASLQANLAADYLKLGAAARAYEHLALAEAAIPDLPEGGYGELVRSHITTLQQRLA